MTSTADQMLDRMRRIVERGISHRDATTRQIANAFTELDAHLTAGGTPPEAWREGPDAPTEPGQTWGWFADSVDQRPAPEGMQVYAHWSLAHNGVNVEIDAPDGLPLTVHINDWEAARLVVGTDEPFSVHNR